MSTEDYIRELLDEREALDPASHAHRLVNDGEGENFIFELDESLFQLCCHLSLRFDKLVLVSTAELQVVR